MDMTLSGGFKRDSLILLAAFSTVPRSVIAEERLFVKVEEPVFDSNRSYQPDYIKFADNRSHNRKRK